MHFRECKTLKDFVKFFDGLDNKLFSELTPYNTTVIVIYDARDRDSIPIFTRIYRSLGYINADEAQEIENQFNLYFELYYF